MSDSKTVVGYIHNPRLRKNVSKEPVGYGIICACERPEGFITLRDHRDPFISRVEAERVKAVIEDVGLCHHEHQIIKVWEVYAGPAGAEQESEERTA